MDIIDIRLGGRRTGVGAMMETDAETSADFESRRQLAVPIEGAAFLLDLHGDNGDLIDSIPISEDGFRETTGEEPKSAEEYEAYDIAYWKEQRAKYRAAARGEEVKGDG